MQFAATLDHLHEMLAYIKTYGKPLGFEDCTLNHIILASEEVLVNIIHYAYPRDTQGTIDIECSILDHPKGITITIRDHGISFDPISYALTPSSPSLPILHHPENSLGGHGIRMSIKLMDKEEYTRVDNTNVMTLTKYL